MNIYLVGGAVRDKLLGLPVQDRDYVVVGSTPEEMVAKGFKPVGADFPVFLHPETKEEYALARTERKSGHGYKGFKVYAAPEVTPGVRAGSENTASTASSTGATVRNDRSSGTCRHSSPASAAIAANCSPMAANMRGSAPWKL